MSDTQQTIFGSILQHVRQIKDTEGNLQTQALLNVCRDILPVVDKLGTGFTPVRMDINGNIERLHKRYETSPGDYCSLYAIIENEVARNDHTPNSSCTKGLLWLKRAMQFVISMLRKLQADENLTVVSAAGNAYAEVLQPYHGWITSSVFTVALKVVPSRQSLYEKLGNSDSLSEEMNSFIEEFDDILSHIHNFLVSKNLNFPDKV